MRRVNPDAVSGSDPVFSGLRAQEILCLARELRSEGIGTTVKHTDMFTLEEENSLWETGILNVNMPKGLLLDCQVEFLLDATQSLFLIGKCLCLRDGRKHDTFKI